MNGRSLRGRLRLYAVGLVNKEEENSFISFYFSVMKHFRYTTNSLSTDMVTGLINAINKSTPQTNVTLNGNHLNHNKKDRVWGHVCKRGQRNMFGRMNNDLHRLRQSKTLKD